MKTGQTISHYTILEKLGEGGMGVVYKTHDIKLDRIVALKFLPADATATEEDKTRFLQEARAAAKLSHPNICSIHAVSEHEDRQFIDMEFVDGETLRRKLSSAQAEITAVIDYAIQTAEALAEAHAHGIVHRDIKPENIMVDSRNRVKVMDFGLAKLKGAANITKKGSTVGTVAYMPPEQLQGKEPDHRTDLFSFGVLFYEMLTGKSPFRGEHEAALMYSIVNEEPVPVTEYIPDASPDLIHLTGRLLEKDPGDRFQSADEVLAELKRIRKKSSGKVPAMPSAQTNIISEETAGESAPSTTVTISIPQFGSRKGIGIIVALLLAVSVAAAWFLITPEPTLTADNRSIAVLPFENLSPNPDDAFFTDGIHDDIITQLSKISDLKVIARSSVMNYPVGERNYRQITEELNVATAMEGSIRRAGDVVRVSVQLIDLQTMQTLWAESFERNLKDIFAIQSEIAREISSSLEIKPAESEVQQIEQPLTDNTEAYDYYLRAWEYMRRPGSEKEDWDNAIHFFERAVETDPEFVNAVASLSYIHALYYWYGHDQTPERLEISKQYADRAYEQDPDAEITNIALGNYYYRSRDYARALSYINKTQSYSLLSYIQRRLGMWEESEENLIKAIERNPRSIERPNDLAFNYWILREYESAIKYYKSTLELAPDYSEAKEELTRIYIYWKGDLEPLREFVSQNPDAEAYNYYMLRDFEGLLERAGRYTQDILNSQAYVIPISYLTGIGYYHLGDEIQAREHFGQAKIVLEELKKEQPEDFRIPAGLSQVNAYLNLRTEAIQEAEKAMEMIPLEKDALIGAAYIVNAAVVYAILGDAEEAVEWIRKALEIPSLISIEILKVDPIWDNIRESESFRQLLREG